MERAARIGEKQEEGTEERYGSRGISCAFIREFFIDLDSPKRL
jgi:hypothetical protein